MCPDMPPELLAALSSSMPAVPEENAVGRRCRIGGVGKEGFKADSQLAVIAQPLPRRVLSGCQSGRTAAGHAMIQDGWVASCQSQRPQGC